VWHITSPWLYLLLNEDGTFIATDVSNWRKPHPSYAGQFRLEGTSLTFAPSDESPLCAGQTGSYQVELTEEGQLQLVLEEEQCEGRSGLPAGPWDRVETTPGIRVEDLTGIWRHPWGMHLKLNEDGTYRLAEIVARLETLPSEFGRFELEGTTFTFITSNESPGCTGQTGSYQVELTEQGKLRFVPLQEDPCQWRADNAPVAWEQVEPSSAPGTYVTPIPPTPIAFKLATSAEEILGTWQLGSYTIRFDDDGTCSQMGPYTSDDRPYAINEFSFDGARMSLKEISVSNVSSCGREVGIYEVRLLGSGTIQIVAINDKCADRAGDVAGEYESVTARSVQPMQQEPEASATSMTNVLPPGTYTMIITEEDLAANNMRSADDRYIFLGEWQTAFDPDGHYITKRTSPDGSSHMVIEEGQYALSADQLTFTGVEMGHACMDSSGVQVGSYRWALDGRTLTLTAIEDKCSDRNFSLTVHPWSKRD